MNDKEYMKKALEGLKEGFSLDMPMLQVIPETSEKDGQDVNLRMADEYQQYYSDYREYEDAIAEQFGFRNKRVGTVPVIEEELPDACGITVYNGNGEAFVVGMNKALRKESSLFRKRVYFHELGHVYAEALVKPCRDLGKKERTMILESIPEYAMAKAFERTSKKKGDEPDKMARLIKATTPYRESVAFGEFADKYFDGGYAGFINTLRSKGGRYAMEAIQKQVLSNSGRSLRDNLDAKAGKYKMAA